jgi:uncharacterized phage-associated protein
MMTNPERAPIKRDDIDTFRDDDSSGGEVPLTTATLSPISLDHRADQGPDETAVRQYRAPMTVSANSIVAAIEADRPGLSAAKTQLLLFFCLGHHFDHTDEPLFAEPIIATETGVQVELAGTTELPPNGPRNTVGYVVSRYANLSPADLRTLITASMPWQLARRPGTDGRIEWVWLSDWFRRDEERNDPDDDRPTQKMIDAWIEERKRNGTWPPKEPEELNA